jgi:hypothetical protein
MLVYFLNMFRALLCPFSGVLSRVTSTVQDTHLTDLRYTTQTAYRFGHQKAVLTNVLLKMVIIMLETC